MKTILIFFIFITACTSINNSRPILKDKILLGSFELYVNRGKLQKGKYKLVKELNDEFVQSINSFKIIPVGKKYMVFGIIKLLGEGEQINKITLYLHGGDDEILIQFENEYYFGKLNLEKFFFLEKDDGI
jgi:hypothetical protein